MKVDSRPRLGDPDGGDRPKGDVMKTVAAISFRDNHSLSMDMDGVNRVEVTVPTQLEDGLWYCEMLIRSENGTVALQMLADDPTKLKVVPLGLE